MNWLLDNARALRTSSEKLLRKIYLCLRHQTFVKLFALRPPAAAVIIAFPLSLSVEYKDVVVGAVCRFSNIHRLVTFYDFGKILKLNAFVIAFEPRQMECEEI
jgi:hypothetical protein